jgi:hypothetical protein
LAGEIELKIRHGGRGVLGRDRAATLTLTAGQGSYPMFGVPNFIRPIGPRYNPLLLQPFCDWRPPRFSKVVVTTQNQ